MTEDTNRGEPATTVGSPRETDVGSVFVSNYPPYSFWTEDDVERATAALDARPGAEAPLGLYVHIPFCRKRCKFCYFKVYTGKNSDEVGRYLDAVSTEAGLYSKKTAVTGRPLRFVYFGGGTPSFISVRHLESLVRRLRDAFTWDGVEEVTFESEPGTLTERKVEMIRKVGVTRLSLGVENFNDRILEENGRAHLSKEIYRCVPWIVAQGFDQLNIDLISGMVGETWETWRESVKRAIDLDPDSVTIYQLELPYNTVYSQKISEGSGLQVADWATKREWHSYAIEELAQAGYEVSSAYTMVKRDKTCRFVYRDSVWVGSDMVGLGVASFSHMSGVHFQNVSGWKEYLDRLEADRLPIHRAFPTSEHERLTREMILQLKLGVLRSEYFERKFDVRILREFGETFAGLERRGMLELGDDGVRLTRQGLLQVDQLLPEFYAPEYRNARYT
jgi:oxygen-independent coproporphyrinogen-3 oxidase